jgi:hypothetical protein
VIGDKELIDLLPHGALRKYIDYWEPTTDAPAIYLVAGALVTAGTLMKSGPFLPFGGQPIYPNLWVLLLGPSSYYRKTTAVNKCRKTIVDVIGDGAERLLLPEEFSREALVRHLSAHPSGLLTSSEFGGLLASFSRDYMAGTKELLADLYDAPPTYSRIVGKDMLNVVQPCLSLFAASQTNWFLEKVKEIDLQSGFLARVIYMPASTKQKTIPIPPDPDPIAGAELKSLLSDVHGIEGKFEFAGGVVDRYARWMIAHEHELHKMGDGDIGRLSPFWTRLTAIALKLGMIMQVSTDGGLVLTMDTLDRALALSDVLKENLKELFLREFTFTKEMATKQKVLRLVAKHGDVGIERRDLMRASNLYKIEFDRVMETLLEEGSVVKSEQGSNTHAHKVRYFPGLDRQFQSAA